MRPYYQDDSCTIYHGDCRKILEDIGTFDLVLTDPPYGHGSAQWQGGKGWGKKWGDEAASWDVRPCDDVMRLVVSAADHSIIWGGNYFVLPPSRCWLCWDKAQKIPTMADFELAWTSFEAPSKSYSSSRVTHEGRQHPTQKPTKLMQWCITVAEKHADIGTVLDPYMGSGTTMLAAKNLGKKAAGIEMEERYCEIAAKRLAQEVLF